jgi:hypothetical protein
MKVLGIEIKGDEAIFCALDSSKDKLSDITGKLTKIELTNDEDSYEIHRFVEVIHSYFDSLNVDKIGIIKRSKSVKGKFISSPISFKLEGLIQTYKKKTIDFIAPQTLTAFFKKNSKDIEPKNKYQNSACDLAIYLTKK